MSEPTTLWDDLAATNQDLRAMLTTPMNAQAHDMLRALTQDLARMLARWAAVPPQFGEQATPTETRQTPLVLYPELMDALRRAQHNAQGAWQRAGSDGKSAAYGAVLALDLLRQELLAQSLVTQERDGAGALPATPAPPVSEPVQPAPSRQVPNGSGYDTLPAPSHPHADYHRLESCGEHHRNYSGVLHSVNNCDLQLCGRVPR